MNTRVRRGVLAALTAFPLLLVTLLARTADAQRQGMTYLSYVGSDVQLVSQGEEDTNARVNMPVLAGDRLSTGSASRAEAILADGTIVRFDARTDARFERLARTYEASDERSLVFLERGGVALEARQAPAGGLRVDTDDATVLLDDAGEVRVDAGRKGTEIYVLSGSVEVNARSGRSRVSAGEVAHVNADDEIELDRADVPRDAFTRFVEDRSERRDASPRYVSADYQYDYEQANLDDYGSWTYASAVSRYCWRPRVAVDWSPYSAGWWRWTPGGLTWVSYEPWGWLPYHYGSWFQDASLGWCWLPGSVYSPAWVYWTYTPSYVGWCPIGYYGYYDPYYRSLRSWYSHDSFCYPHLRGRIDLGRIDRRAWNFVPVDHVARRLDRRDVISGAHVAFRQGDVGVVATAPLRVERPSSGSVALAVREAVRRVPTTTDVREGRRVDEGLTAVLRRERGVAIVEQELRRTAVRAGQDASYRPTSSEWLARREAPPRGEIGATRADATRRSDVSASTAGPRLGGGREGDAVARSWRETPRASEAPTRLEPRRGEVSASPRSDDGWRAQPGAPALRSTESRRSEAGERPAAPRADGGWRAPERSNAAPRAHEGRRADAPRRDAPSEGWRRGDAPPRADAPRRESPPPRSYDAPRRESPPPPPAPPRSDPPRREGRTSSYDTIAPWRDAPPRRAEPYASRSWDRTDPRAYGAPRAMDAPSYAPPRRYEAPRPAAPREYAAPRAWEPPRSSYAAPRFEPRSAPAPPPRAYEAPRFQAPAAPPRMESRPAPHAAPHPAPPAQAPPRRG